MKLFSILSKHITIIIVMFFMVFGLNAENYTFATLADMHAATDLKDGDIVSIDLVVLKNGFHGDAARTFVVGNALRLRSKKLCSGPPLTI